MSWICGFIVGISFILYAIYLNNSSSADAATLNLLRFYWDLITKFLIYFLLVSEIVMIFSYNVLRINNHIVSKSEIITFHVIILIALGCKIISFLV